MPGIITQANNHSFLSSEYFSEKLSTLVENIGILTEYLAQLWTEHFPRTLVGAEADLNPGPVFKYVTMSLMGFVEIKSQCVTGFPFHTHPHAVKVSITSILFYGFASIADRAASARGLNDTSVFAIIARLGRIFSLCIFMASLAYLFYF
ncbi:hypothetical protein CTI12_AA130030 [Artemisia annua]|uniref:Uncharacterized protein n=1 Tax=Artemisia annua TaxID=35608 RepID=A0A2U1PP43_ARTAN|nr:hypothetical protein CTI12_AA130030 [Artemisia annua]